MGFPHAPTQEPPLRQQIPAGALGTLPADPAGMTRERSSQMPGRHFWDWVRLKQRIQNLPQASHRGGKGSATQAVTCCLPQGALAKGLPSDPGCFSDLSTEALGDKELAHSCRPVIGSCHLLLAPCPSSYEQMPYFVTNRSQVCRGFTELRLAEFWSRSPAGDIEGCGFAGNTAQCLEGTTGSPPRSRGHRKRGQKWG